MNTQEIIDNLDKATGRGIRVAILDSGIDREHEWVQPAPVTHYAVVDGALAETDGGDLVGHGTAVASQVYRIAPEAELIDVRVLNERNACSSAVLCAAIEGMRDLDVHVVNLSLSTMRKEFGLAMSLAIDDLVPKRVTTVCARGYHKTGKAYPTYFANTIGVTYEDSAIGVIDFNDGELVEFTGSGVDHQVAWRHGAKRLMTGSSFACPLVAGIIARIRELDPTLHQYEIMAILKHMAKRMAAEPEWRPVTPIERI